MLHQIHTFHSIFFLAEISKHGITKPLPQIEKDSTSCFQMSVNSSDFAVFTLIYISKLVNVMLLLFGTPPLLFFSSYYTLQNKCINTVLHSFTKCTLDRRPGLLQ